MQVDKDSQVIILPRLNSLDHSTEHKIINLPIPKSSSSSSSSSTVSTKSYLIQDSRLFELNVIKGDNSNVRLKSGDAVKSYIFEPVIEPKGINSTFPADEDNRTQGAVLQSCHTLIASPYNFTYLLITIFEKHGDKFSRFHTLDDIRDRLLSLELGHDWVYDIPRVVFLKSLANICESIIEGGGGNGDGNGEEGNRSLSDAIEDAGDRFFKYSETKSLEWINSKIVALQQWILHLDDDKRTTNSIMSKIKKGLHDPTRNEDTSTNQEEEQNQLMDQMAMIYAIDYVCDSYIPDTKSKIILQFKYDFGKVDDYFAQLKQKQKDLEAVEANMNEVITATANTTNASATGTKKNGKKKNPVKKVAVGKGALDGFFKKA